MSETKSTTQSAEVRVSRANLYRRIGRLCFSNGDQPALPAPHDASFNSGTVWLTFDTYDEAATWAQRYGLEASTDRVYQPEWNDGPIRALTASGTFETDVPVVVSGWTAVAAPDTSAPEDTDPDDLSAVES